ncbi:MAG: prepilin-type N-terminal cleavage/methylation domain-containing protein [Candidatus Aminicenantes bacterium]|nr:prepilin-type N-terminal cleavage/methylation domain-containing protein [Candidatus Aminicenantes bacterium]
MLKKMRGFTLIELLIVVAIIGILAVLLVPNAITAIQKAKQKSTMKSITTIATAVADYITDNGEAPAEPSGNDLDAADPFYDCLAPFYVRVIPENDEWGEPFKIWTNTNVDGNYGIADGLSGDFLITSWGRNSELEGFNFDPDNPEQGYFAVNSMDDFTNDLVSYSGSWIRAPRALATAGS